jgi:hypothetical protein
MSPCFGSRERSCFVHVGTHKTGTTAIQRFLADNQERLAGAGLYYPRTGWPSSALPGHHVVASELAGDRLVDRAGGTLDDAVAEFARARARIACLSSENFEYLHVRDDALVRLRDAIAATGYRPRIVLYVRTQQDYAESLYAELVKHGLAVPFRSFLDEIVANGVVRYDRAWTFRFDYLELASRFANVFGPESVIVRAYRDDGSAHSIVRDFLAAVGFDGAPVDGFEPAYENVRLTTGGVITQLFRNAADVVGDPRIAGAGTDLVTRHARDASEPFHPLTSRDRARLSARFAGDNARLIERWPAAAGIADRRRATRLEAEPAQSARRLFEYAESVRGRFVADPQRAHRAVSAR